MPKKSHVQLDREIAEALAKKGTGRRGERLADSRYMLAEQYSGEIVRPATATEVANYRASKGKGVPYTDHRGNERWGYIGRLYEDAAENQYLVDIFDE